MNRIKNTIRENYERHVYLLLFPMLICSSVGNIMSHSNNQELQRYTSMLHLLVPTFCIIQMYMYIWILKP